MCIYGYGCAVGVNCCSFSWLKTSASFACFVQSSSQPVCSPNSWHHGGETGLCRRRSDTAQRARGHKNHKNPEFDIVEQQIRSLLSWFRKRKVHAASWITVNFKDFMVWSFSLLLSIFNISFLPSLCWTRLLQLLLVLYEKQLQQSCKSPRTIHHMETWQLMGSVSVAALSFLCVPKQCGFISALHYFTVHLLSVTSHPQKDLEVS